MRQHPDLAEYHETLDLLRVEVIRVRERAKRAKALLAAIIHGDANVDDIVDSVTEREKH